MKPLKEKESENSKDVKKGMDIVPVCCFFLTLIIFGMSVLKDNAKSAERPSIRSQIEALYENNNG